MSPYRRHPLREGFEITVIGGAHLRNQRYLLKESVLLVEVCVKRRCLLNGSDCLQKASTKEQCLLTEGVHSGAVSAY